MDPVLDGAADSSPAIEQPAAVGARIGGTKRSIGDLSPAERLEWRKTGTIPDAPAASSTATVADPPAVTTATSDPASEPAHDDPDYKPKTAKRIQELLAENKRLREAAVTPPARRDPPASPAAPVVTSTLVKPDPEKFTYGTADPDFLEALTDYKVAVTLEKERTAAAESDQRRASEDAMAETNRSWQERRTAAEAKYPDFKEVALADWTPGHEIRSGTPVDAWILESEMGADVLYALQKNPAEIRRINALVKPDGRPDGVKQARELALLEERIKTAATVKTQTTAPDPGPTLGVRAGDASTPVARAIKKGDASAYIREQNRIEMAARSARRGH